jgi:hypothetical protein
MVEGGSDEAGSVPSSISRAVAMDDGQALVRLVGRRRRGGRCGGRRLVRLAEEHSGAALAGNVVDGGGVDG